jgi:hypothetical protein
MIVAAGLLAALVLGAIPLAAMADAGTPSPTTATVTISVTPSVTPASSSTPTPVPTPAAPQGLTVERRGELLDANNYPLPPDKQHFTAFVTWQVPAGFNGVYQLERQTNHYYSDVIPPYTQVAELPASAATKGVLTFEEPVHLELRYCYRVRAVDASGPGPYSASDCTVTPPTSGPGAEPPPTWAYASNTRTGITPVDKVLAAVQGQDINALRSQFVFVDQPCTEPQGIGAIPCPEGTALGTPVQVFLSGSCEGSFIFPDQTETLEAVVTNFVSVPLYLYAIAAAPANDTRHASYLLFFGQAADSGTPGVQGRIYPGKTVWVDDTGVVAVNSGCGDGVAHRAVQIPHGTFILAPKTTAPTPQPPIVGTGTAHSSNAPGAIVLLSTLAAVFAGGCIVIAVAGGRKH